MVQRRKKPRGKSVGDLDAAAWRQIIGDIPIPLFIEDVSAIRPLIVQAAAAVGVEGFPCWLDAHPEFVGRVIGRVKIVGANRAAVALNAATSEEELLVSLEKLLLPKTLGAFKEMICVMATGGGHYEGSSWYRSLDGREYETLNMCWIPAVDDPVQIVALATVDVSDLKAVERSLTESEQRYRLLIETARDVVIQHDLGGKVTFANRAAVVALGVGREQLLGRAFDDVVRKVIPGLDGSLVYEAELVRDDGQTVPVEVSSSLLPAAEGTTDETQVQLVARDISARQQSARDQQAVDARLRNTQKMESLAVLADGLGHDFNNLLVTILGNAELLRSGLPQGDPRRECVLAIEEAGNQVATLCGQLQRYTGSTGPHGEFGDLSEIVDGIDRLLQVPVPDGAVVELDLASGLPPVDVDRAEIAHVIMNLVTNAAEASGASGSGVRVRTGQLTLGEEELKKWTAGAELAPGPHVFCEVRDQGVGMDAEGVARMFEPFYSTKSAGRGLGLSASLGIVQQHGGAFAVTSQPGAGTSVTVWLPVVENGAAGEVCPLSGNDPLECDLAGRTIMLVDDNARVRAVAESFLRRLGCRVLSVADGYEAVRIYGLRHAEIDAILLDFTMPHLDGLGTSRRLRSIRPDVPLLMTSGANESETRAKCEEYGLRGFVAKPYTLQKLKRELALVLGAN